MFKKIFYILLMIAFSASANAIETNSYTYTVRSRDTLSEITSMFTGNYNFTKVAKNNGIKNPDMIYPGTKIKLNIPKWALMQEQFYGDYVVRIYRYGDGFFQILKEGSQVYAHEGGKFSIGSIYEDEKKSSLISIGTNITGDGQPDLVISEWTGGAHCCFNFYLFEIGEHFRYIQKIDTKHSDLADFENLDTDPALEFRIADWTFAYWRTSFAASPAPEIILKYTGQKYEMAYDLMRKAALKQNDLNSIADEIRTLPDWNQEPPPVRLWGEMLNLIYIGNMAQAWILADIAWPQNVGGKQTFLKDFKTKLKESPFWKEIQQLNQN